MDIVPAPPSAGARARRKHEQIRAYLEELLEALEPGEPLPSECELAERFGVARMTVRQAMDRLVRAGRVDRVQGAGSFRAPYRSEQPLVLTSFSEDMRARGLEPGGRVLALRRHEPGAQLARRLGLPADAPVLCVERLRTADGRPMALERATLDAARVPGLVAADLAEASLHRLLRERHGIVLRSAEQRLRAALCRGRDAELLEVGEGTPALEVERTASDVGGRPVEHVRSLYRGDRYELRMVVPGR